MAVNKNNAGVWYFKVRWTDARGVQHQKKKENRKWKRADAQKAERLFIQSLENSYSLADDMTYGELFELYVKSKKEEIKTRTFMAYKEKQQSFVLPKFENIPLSKINRRSVADWQNWLLKQKTPKGEPYSNSYLRAIQTGFKQVINWAVDEGYLSETPFKKKNAIRKDEPKKEMNFWTPDEFQKFYDKIDNLQDKVTFRILYWCGLRKGELIGLNIEDYDPTTKTISINKQWDTRNKKMTSPKNERGHRKVSVDTETARLIETLIAYYKRCGGYRPDAPMIGFTKRLPAQTLDNRKKKYIIAAGVKNIRIHDFRHSHVSYLINQGFQPSDVAARLGHTVTETLNRYGHLYPDRQQKMAENIDKNHEKSKSGTILVRIEN
ncbi:site-specific integrase [Holdemania sp. 1001302B_160321_E10]|uniref:tyrosine-type recombinase/integrase n=1 Tax=Holdemania sp. 1001302B_160321_E10 TaxID=2787120 RepID=UPI00189B36CB|nr:site-specific integrase [Holdemania sp. 1001302B_160321_E10]